ncbi:DUF866-domain-containing protein, partial [Cristinia sonorae]
KLLLSIKADLENVTDLVPSSDAFDYFFQVQCSSCHETHPKFVSVNREEEHAVSGSKGATAHFVWKCSSCKRESTAKFETNAPPKPYSADANGQFAPLVTLECRGLEFVGFDPRGTWKCVGAESGTVFSEIEIEDGEWVDYDEKVRQYLSTTWLRSHYSQQAAQPVGVSNIESKWSRA